MERLVREALEQYDLGMPQLEFIRHNENMTYKLTDGEKQFVMRMHKPVSGFSLGIYAGDASPIEYLESEMLIINYIGRHTNIPMQKPVLNKVGATVSILPDGTPVTILEWVQGKTVADINVTEEIGEAIGTMVARLHECLQVLDIDKEKNIFSRALNINIKRFKYNQNLLSAVEDQLAEAIKKGQITKEHAEIMKGTLYVIKCRMDELDDISGMSGIVHADLSQSNLIVSGDYIVPIDFSLSGYGYYYMDMGMILSQYNDLKIRKSIKSGYEKIMQKEVPVRYLEPFFALSVLLYIACQHDKACKEDWFESAVERWCNTIFILLNNDKNFIF